MSTTFLADPPMVNKTINDKAHTYDPKSLTPQQQNHPTQLTPMVQQLWWGIKVNPGCAGVVAMTFITNQGSKMICFIDEQTVVSWLPGVSPMLLDLVVPLTAFPVIMGKLK